MSLFKKGNSKYRRLCRLGAISDIRPPALLFVEIPRWKWLHFEPTCDSR